MWYDKVGLRACCSAIYQWEMMKWLGDVLGSVQLVLQQRCVRGACLLKDRTQLNLTTPPPSRVRLDVRLVCGLNLYEWVDFVRMPNRWIAGLQQPLNTTTALPCASPPGSSAVSSQGQLPGAPGGR